MAFSTRLRLFGRGLSGSGSCFFGVAGYQGIDDEEKADGIVLIGRRGVESGKMLADSVDSYVAARELCAAEFGERKRDGLQTGFAGDLVRVNRQVRNRNGAAEADVVQIGSRTGLDKCGEARLVHGCEDLPTLPPCALTNV